MCAKLSVTQLKSPILTISVGQPVHFDSSKNNLSYIIDFFNFCVDLFTSLFHDIEIARKDNSILCKDNNNI